MNSKSEVKWLLNKSFPTLQMPLLQYRALIRVYLSIMFSALPSSAAGGTNKARQRRSRSNLSIVSDVCHAILTSFFFLFSTKYSPAFIYLVDDYYFLNGTYVQGFSFLNRAFEKGLRAIKYQVEDIEHVEKISFFNSTHKIQDL